MRRQQAANNADVRLEHRHVDVLVEVHLLDERMDATELRKVAHGGQCVQGIDQGQRIAAPRIVAIAGERTQFIIAAGVLEIAVVGVLEHAAHILPA